MKQVPFFSVKQAPNFTFSVKHVGNNLVRKFIVAYFGKQVPLATRLGCAKLAS